MPKSKIEWTDETWNPVIGCLYQSDGCKNCYAARMGYRQIAMGNDDYSSLVGENLQWSGLYRFLAHRLPIPLRRKKPTKFFVNSMGDLFYHKITPFHVDAVFGIMAGCPQHTFQILTKRPGIAKLYFDGLVTRAHELCKQNNYPAEDVDFAILMIWRMAAMRAMHSADLEHPIAMGDSFPLKNVWFGATVENQEMANLRVPVLIKLPVALRFVSCEPLLEEIDLRPWPKPYYWLRNRYPLTIDWVIAGGETGPNARPVNEVCFWKIKNDCVAAGVPFFFKGYGTANVSKKNPSYYKIDGHEWHQMPQEKSLC